METTYYIIETINGQQYNVGRVYSEKDAIQEIEERIAYDAKYGRNTRDNYSYSQNRYDC